MKAAWRLLPKVNALFFASRKTKKRAIGFDTYINDYRTLRLPNPYLTLLNVVSKHGEANNR